MTATLRSIAQMQDAGLVPASAPQRSNR